MTGKQFTSVWTREPRPARSPGRSRDEIVRAAVELLDAEGLDGLSMRKLGAKLGSGATSLYWYVANKDELLELVYDEFWSGMTMPDPAEASWRHAVGAFARGLRQLILRHPWSVGLIGRTPALGPNAMGITDSLRRAFKLAGFAGLEIDYANTALTAYVFGMTIPEVAWNQAVAEHSFDRASMVEAVATAAADYPELAKVIQEAEHADPLAVREMAFSFGLASMLDGLEARLVT
ncbi:TetR/AcrR family transcriptional regulator [Nonomuraea sp. LPB2021202275-12-8]|uniref:TetR/AcrR family transcriptional regulator n=1 Tax=Nonomuraea sp. LPB2021202275-12-8 TaxID=3120159 RepID=UPI00300CA390